MFTPAHREMFTPANGEMFTPAQGEMFTPAHGEMFTPADGEMFTSANGNMLTPANGEMFTPANGSCVFYADDEETASKRRGAAGASSSAASLYLTRLAMIAVLPRVMIGPGSRTPDGSRASSVVDLTSSQFPDKELSPNERRGNAAGLSHRRRADRTLTMSRIHQLYGALVKGCYDTY
ncbi:hypothetical protein EYF80_048587 [Liparis tanakae]|uniref:Uncharacterized protein n=1 Tax=Liparis tanakae TaxID=230148 RepID=A0A4Z2FLU7_9TELE|nr:hypothetical protein EYF80_048587 [Liparis tanakae]